MGRTAQGIFDTDIGGRIRMRPAQAIESIARGEAVVKTIAEIAPSGFLYTDITPFELSFLSVLVGEYVDIRINGITYRSRVVDDALIAAEYPSFVPDDTSEQPLISDDILIYPNDDHIIITHTPNNTITAEGRFQVSVGDAIVIEPAPN